jgi:hypothetical protein
MSKAIYHKATVLLIVLYTIIATIEIIAELFHNKLILWLVKPLLMPILILYYIVNAKKVNYLFVTALICTLLANIFFIYRDEFFILTGSCFFLLYRTLIIYLVVKLVKLPSYIPVLLGSIPFIFIYASTCFLTYSEFGNALPLFIAHGVFVIFLGGFSLGNYMIWPNKTNLYLFGNAMFIALSQFIFVVKLYTPYDNLLHSIAMILFVFAQYFIVKFMLSKDDLNPIELK